MAGLFTTFGESIRASLTNFAEAASSSIIANVSPVIYTCVLLYFCIRAYQISSGRAEGAIPDLITQCAKVSIIAFFALNSANFIQYIIPAVYGIESMLLEAISKAVGSDSVYSAWGAADETWSTFMKGFAAIQNIWNKMSWGMFGDSITVIAFILLMMILMLFVSIYFMFFAVGYLLLYEIFLVMGLAFGPLFICALMFTATRSWFEGWLRAVVCWAFTLAAVAATLFLIDGIFIDNIDDLVRVAGEAQKGGEFSKLLLKLVTFSVLVLAIATVVKSIPTFAAGITGGIALQAASAAGMLSSIGKTLAAMTGGAMLGYAAATHNDELRDKARNVLGHDGLTNPGAFGFASLGYTIGKPMSFFSGQDAEANSGNAQSNAPSNMVQTPQQEQTAAQNAAALGVAGAFGSTGSGSSAFSSGTSSASAPVSFSQPSGASSAAVSSANAGGTGAASQTSGTYSTGAGTAVSAGAAVSASGYSGQSAAAPASDFTSSYSSGSNSSGADFVSRTTQASGGQTSSWEPDFSTDYSQFDSRAQFNEPESSPPVGGASATTESSEEAKENVQAKANEQTADEILRNRQQGEKNE